MRSGVYGLLADFEDVDALVAAATDLYIRGYKHVRAFTPYPVREVNALFRARFSWIAPIVFFGGAGGGASAFFMQWYASVVSYPENVGGRPLNSWPAFIPITFELTVLGAALAGVAGMLLLNRLPMLHHPVFDDSRFVRASQDRFFLCVEARDRKYDDAKTRALLASLSHADVTEVRW